MLLLFLFSINLYAESFQRITLKHRDAVDMQAVLTPILPKGSALAADGNTLVISGPAKTNASLAALIKRMDKPRKQLKVSVFQGRYPQKKGVLIHSTNKGINKEYTIVVQEGYPFAMTEQGIVHVPLSKKIYGGDLFDQAATPSSLLDASTLLADEGVLNELLLSVGERVIQNQAATRRQAEDAFIDTQSEIIPMPSGVYMRVVLRSKKTANIQAKVIAPVANTELESTDYHALTNTLETNTRISLGQWSRLHQQNTISHQPEIRTGTTVYSTATTKDRANSVWVKVVVEP